MEAKLDSAIFCKIINTPLGEMVSTYNNSNLISLQFIETDSIELEKKLQSKPDFNDNELSKELQDQLIAYFSGKQKQFSIPLERSGSLFQNQVWNELKKIPYGETISYRTLSERLGDVKKIRAAAAANGKNPFMIVVPCHRVLGIDGKMIGYAGGLERKRKLILLEQSNIAQKRLLF